MILNDVLIARFPGRVSRIEASLQIDAPLAVVRAWLRDHCQGDNLPSAEELLGAVPAHEAATIAASAAAAQQRINEAAKAALLEIDLASVRALREYVAAKPDAPQILKDREQAAANERAKIK